MPDTHIVHSETSRSPEDRAAPYTHFFDIPWLGTLMVDRDTRRGPVSLFRERVNGEYFLMIGHWEFIWTPARWRPTK